MIWAAVACCLGIVTRSRNTVYASELGMWEEVAERIAPKNARAHSYYAESLQDPVRSVEEFKRSIALDPSRQKLNAGVYNNLGRALARQGKNDEAMAQYQIALECDPNEAMVHANIATIYAQRGDYMPP